MGKKLEYNTNIAKLIEKLGGLVMIHVTRFLFSMFRYQFVGKVELDDRIVAARRPEKRQDCEVILLCGLPFSGKTIWATKHAAEHPEKMYSVLGIHNLIEKMRVSSWILSF